MKDVMASACNNHQKMYEEMLVILSVEQKYLHLSWMLANNLNEQFMNIINLKHGIL